MFQSKAGFNEEPAETPYKRYGGGEAVGIVEPIKFIDFDLSLIWGKTDLDRTY